MRLTIVFFSLIISSIAFSGLNAQEVDSITIDCREKLELVQVSGLKYVVINDGKRLKSNDLLAKAKDNDLLKKKIKSARTSSAFSVLTAIVSSGFVGYSGVQYASNKDQFNPVVLGVGLGFWGISAVSKAHANKKLAEYVRIYNKTLVPKNR